MDSLTEIAIIGAGSWGTGLAWLMARNGRRVRLWARDAALAADIEATRRNRRYLPEAPLPAAVQATADLAAAVRGCGLLLVVVPSVGVPEMARHLAPLVPPGTTVISAAKGLDHETGRRMSVVLSEALPPGVAVGALSGPNLAHEIIAGQPSASVVATADRANGRRVQLALSSESFRAYYSPDIAGVELGGALKNPLAIAAGVADGLGYGDNTKAALMTRGMVEICRLSVALGASERTLTGLCGFGDLLATCHSRLSRNRNLGEQLGRGRRLSEIVAETTQVAEGVPTCRTALRLAREHGVDMPIFSALHRALFEDCPASVVAQALMAREVTDEFRESAP